MVEVNAIAAPDHRTTIATKVPGESDSRAEIVFVVFDNFTREWAADDFQRLEGSILGGVCVVDKTKVNVVTNAEIECESRRNLPVVLNINRELLRALAQVEAGIAARKNDLRDDANAVEI